MTGTKRKKKTPQERGYITREEMVATLRAWADSIEKRESKYLFGGADWFKMTGSFSYEYNEPESTR